MKATEQIKRAAFEKTFDYFLSDPEHNVVKIMDLLDKVAPDNLFASQRQSFRNAIDNKDHWFQLIMHILNDTNPKVRDTLLKTFVIDGNLMAWPKQEENRDKYQCNILWAILLDPTSACNLHCQGCWAAEYGNNQNLSFDEIDSIIKQGKELGTHVYIYTGGEPLVRKKDLIKLRERHSDCVFLAFANGTLVDEDFCQEMTSENICIISCVKCVRKSHSLPWISKTMVNMLEVVSRVVDVTYILILQVMWIRAYLFIIPMPIFVKYRYWMRFVRRFLWSITRSSHLMTTYCVLAPF